MSDTPATPNGDTPPRAKPSRELPVLILIAIVIAFLLRSFVVQVFFIPSSSMEPTLMVNDRIVVEKVTYRFRPVQRGDIVVFESEEVAVDDPAPLLVRAVRGFGQVLGVVPTSARDYVKRVIAIGGDELLIVDGTVFLNGTAVDEPYVVYRDGDAFGPITVPDGALFFMGDNRPNSADSRRSLGSVSEDRVVGRAAAVIWPPGRIHTVTNK
ncbi:MAG: signal peptidase I [Nitriliruptoraceae bacterium]